MRFWDLEGQPMTVPVTAIWYIVRPAGAPHEIDLWPPPPQHAGYESAPDERQTAIIMNNTAACGLVSVEVKVAGGVTRRRTSPITPQSGWTKYFFGLEGATKLDQDATFGLSMKPEIDWVHPLEGGRGRIVVRLGVSESLDEANAARLATSIRLFGESDVLAMGLPEGALDSDVPIEPRGGGRASAATWNPERDRLTLTFDVPDDMARSSWYVGYVAPRDAVADLEGLPLGLGYTKGRFDGPVPGRLARAVFLRSAWTADRAERGEPVALAAWKVSHSMFAKVEWPPAPCSGTLDPFTWPGEWRRPMEEGFFGSVLATPTPRPTPLPFPSDTQTPTSRTESEQPDEVEDEPWNEVVEGPSPFGGR